MVKTKNTEMFGIEFPIICGAMMVGQSIGLIHSVPTCAELLRDMMQEAVEQINSVQGKIGA